jgi:hypothetical protein
MVDRSGSISYSKVISLLFNLTNSEIKLVRPMAAANGSIAAWKHPRPVTNTNI